MVPTVQLSQSAIFFCWRCASDAFQHVAMCIQLQPKRPTLVTLLHVSQEVDHLGRPLHQQPQQQLRPFLPTGRNSRPDMLLRGQAADLLAGLDATLSKDWPQSFIKVCRTSPNSVASGSAIVNHVATVGCMCLPDTIKPPVAYGMSQYAAYELPSRRSAVMHRLKQLVWQAMHQQLRPALPFGRMPGWLSATIAKHTHITCLRLILQARVCGTQFELVAQLEHWLMTHFCGNLFSTGSAQRSNFGQLPVAFMHPLSCVLAGFHGPRGVCGVEL